MRYTPVEVVGERALIRVCDLNEGPERKEKKPERATSSLTRYANCATSVRFQELRNFLTSRGREHLNPRYNFHMAYETYFRDDRCLH